VALISGQKSGNGIADSHRARAADIKAQDNSIKYSLWLRDSDALGSTSNLLGRLVKPGLDVVLPVLAEVVVGDRVVVLDHLLLKKKGIATVDGKIHMK